MNTWPYLFPVTIATQNYPREYSVIIIRETVHHNMQYLYVFPSKNANAVEDQPVICKSNKTAVNIKAKAVLSRSFQTFIPKVLWKYTA